MIEGTGYASPSHDRVLSAALHS